MVFENFIGFSFKARPFPLSSSTVVSLFFFVFDGRKLDPPRGPDPPKLRRVRAGSQLEINQSSKQDKLSKLESAGDGLFGGSERVCGDRRNLTADPIPFPSYRRGGCVHDLQGCRKLIGSRFERILRGRGECVPRVTRERTFFSYAFFLSFPPFSHVRRMVGYVSFLNVRSSGTPTNFYPDANRFSPPQKQNIPKPSSDKHFRDFYGSILFPLTPPFPAYTPTSHFSGEKKNLDQRYPSIEFTNIHSRK